MKLTKAQCPNCGANLEVNEESKIIKCKYCDTNILVEQTNEKTYKNINAENSNGIENLLRLGERNYSKKAYGEAYKNYNAVIEIEANNTISMLRHAICKTLLNNYIDFKLDYLIQELEDIIKILKEKNEFESKIESYIEEAVFAIDESLKNTLKYENAYMLNERDLEEVNSKLISIINAYEFVLEYTQQNKNHVIIKIISVLKEIIKEKKYKSGRNEFGEDIIKKYKIKLKEQNYYNKKIEKYEKMLLNPGQEQIEKNKEMFNTSNQKETEKKDESNQEKLENKNLNEEKNKVESKTTLKDEKKSNWQDKIKNHKIKKKFDNSIGVVKEFIQKLVIACVDVFLGVLILGCILSRNIVTPIISIAILIILNSQKVNLKLFNNDKKKKRITIIILFILWFATMGV